MRDQDQVLLPTPVVCRKKKTLLFSASVFPPASAATNRRRASLHNRTNHGRSLARRVRSEPLGGSRFSAPAARPTKRTPRCYKVCNCELIFDIPISGKLIDKKCDNQKKYPCGRTCPGRQFCPVLTSRASAATWILFLIVAQNFRK